MLRPKGQESIFDDRSLQQRDVLSVIAGLESTQKINEEDCTTPAITLANFADATNEHAIENSLLPDTSHSERLYFIQLCKLSELGKSRLYNVQTVLFSPILASDNNQSRKAQVRCSSIISAQRRHLHHRYTQ